MNTTSRKELEAGRMPARTRQQARNLLEGLHTAYQSLLPAERIVIRGIVAQSARKRFTQEHRDEGCADVC